MAERGVELELVRIVAGGGFGTVCQVRDPHGGHVYAAKVLRRFHARNPKVLARIRDEAALLTRLRHPNIVHVHGLYEIAGRPLLVMEWIEGVSLERALGAEGPLPVAEVAEIVAITADALSFAHHRPDPSSGRPLEVIHRDLKPANLLLTHDGVLKLVDFGIARGDFEGREAHTESMVLGTRAYVAPERLDGRGDHSAGDVYALGCMLFELLEGEALTQSMALNTHERHLVNQAARLDPPALDDAATGQLQSLVRDMCSYHPDDRPPLGQVSARLARILYRCRLSPDLPRLAARIVVPLLDARDDRDPRDHPAYAEVRFLDPRSGEGTPPAAGP